MTRAILILIWLAVQPGAALAGSVQALLDRLGDADSERVAAELQAEIWDGWINDHRDAGERGMMRAGMLHMQIGDLAAAEAVFTDLIAANPDFVEAWNKRATARFMAGDIAGSERDVVEVLTREPRHFGAISGLALIRMRQGNLETAMRVYERLLQVNPYSPDAVRLLPELRRRLGIADL